MTLSQPPVEGGCAVNSQQVRRLTLLDCLIIISYIGDTPAVRRGLPHYSWTGAFLSRHASIPIFPSYRSEVSYGQTVIAKAWFYSD